MNFVVKNWKKFQNYEDRNPPWIKLYRQLLDDYEFNQLTEVQQIHLVKIWLLFAREYRPLPIDPKWIAFKIHAQGAIDLEALVAAGFLVPTESSDPVWTPVERKRGHKSKEATEISDGLVSAQKRA
jgi:hypothetical protein